MRDSIKLLLIILAISAVAVLAVLGEVWLSGLDGHFPSGKLVFIFGYATMDEDEIFNILVSVKNVGGRNVKIDSLMLNGHTPSYWHDFISQNITGPELGPGESANAVIRLRKGSEWTSGMGVDVRIITGWGYEYPKTVVLP